MKTRTCAALSFLVLTTGLSLVMSGCAGYQLGSMLPPDIKTVYVPTFVNTSSEPLIEDDTTRATIQEIQKDGSLKLATKDDADAILDVTVFDYSLSPVAYQKDNRTAANQYRLTLLASISMKRRTNDVVIVDNPRVKGETVFDVVGDLTTSKQNALPDASKDLAHSIVESIVETWQ